MIRQVKVVFLIGDVYRDFPAAFAHMAKIFAYESTEDQGVRFEVIPNMDIEIIALAVEQYTDQLTKLCSDKLYDTQKYRKAVEDFVEGRLSPISEIAALNPHLLVIGQTVLLERITARLARIKGDSFYPLILRFSTFYSQSSAHTGFSAQEVGYNLDIPKDLQLLQNLLLNGAFLKAVLDQDQNQLRQAIKELNLQPQFQNKPILEISLQEVRH